MPLLKTFVSQRPSSALLEVHTHALLNFPRKLSSLWALLLDLLTHQKAQLTALDLPSRKEKTLLLQRESVTHVIWKNIYLVPGQIKLTLLSYTEMQY